MVIPNHSLPPIHPHPPTPTPKYPPSQSDYKNLYFKLTTNYAIEKQPRKKMNPDQNWKEFHCKIFCWRCPINWYGNSCVKFKRTYFKKDFFVKIKSTEFFLEWTQIKIHRNSLIKKRERRTATDTRDEWMYDEWGRTGGLGRV